MEIVSMRVRSVVLAVLFAAFTAMAAAQGYPFSLSQLLGGSEEQKLDTFKLIHVADLKTLLAKRGNKVHVYDANTDVTRQKFGTIPGAILLASDENYPLSVLPPYKHAALVFYCANQH
jgi:hypothetical protein